MSKILPTILTTDNPVNLDKVIADLQAVIATATFLDNGGSPENWYDQGLLLPLAIKDQVTGGPIIYWQKKEYFPAVPNDNFRAMSFFYQEDPSSFPAIDNQQYTINLVTWFNQDKYVRDKNFSIREFFITELLTLLRRVLKGQENKQSLEVHREIENVFTNYTFISETKERLKYPYQAFRIKFTTFRNFDCGTNAKLNLQ